METIVRKHIAHILKYIVLQHLGWGRGNVVIFLFFIFSSICLIVSILVALLLLF